MKIISIDESNINNEHICCALSNDKKNRKRAETKKNWMKDRFKDGLVFKRFDARGKFFIEYIPIEKAWKPIIGKNYLVINCLWISGKFKNKGLSEKLLNECIKDAKDNNKEGIVVVSSEKVKPYLTDSNFFKYHGFKVVDTAPPYFVLLALKFNKKSADPYFAEHTKKKTIDYKDGFKFIYSNQCPFMEEYVGLLSKILKERNLKFHVEKIDSIKKAKSIGSPFGTFSLYYKGIFQTHELMSEKKFKKKLDSMNL